MSPSEDARERALWRAENDAAEAETERNIAKARAERRAEGFYDGDPYAPEGYDHELDDAGARSEERERLVCGDPYDSRDRENRL